MCKYFTAGLYEMYIFEMFLTVDVSENKQGQNH